MERTLEEIVQKYCRWCQMKEEECLNDLFKETQIHLTSIHLHAFSYTVRRNDLYSLQVDGMTFQTELPKWDIFSKVSKDSLLSRIEAIKQRVTELERESSHSFFVS